MWRVGDFKKGVGKGQRLARDGVIGDCGLGGGCREVKDG